MKIAVCRHCGKQYEVSGLYYNYGYKHITKLPYPKVSKGWCINCNNFVDIQLGYHKQEIEEQERLIDKELEGYNGVFSFIKSHAQKHRLLNLKSELSLMKTFLNNEDRSYDCCLECGSSNVIFKNLEDGFWVCPQCNLGRLEIIEEEDDLLFRLADKIISPSTNKSSLNLPLWVLVCAYELLKTEFVFLNDKEISYNPSIIENTCLVVAFLEVIQGLKPNVRKDLLDEFCLYDSTIKKIPYRELIPWFESAIEFYKKELAYMKDAEHPLPTEILQNLLCSSPQKQTNIDAKFMSELHILLQFELWNYIIDIIKIYFKERR